ncbi:MAG: carboxymuconolactone decarboxylase family protein [Halioglobus sp.]
MKHVLRPISEPYASEIAEIFSRYPQDKDGYILKLFRVFANSKRFLASKGVINLLDSSSPLPIREREIVILRVTSNSNCEYEWGVHVTSFSRAAQLTSEQVRATRLSVDEVDCWTKDEQLLIRCVDQLCSVAKIEDDTYDRFQERWNLEQQLEIFALCGNYHLVSCIANCARLEPEPGVARFPV